MELPIRYRSAALCALPARLFRLPSVTAFASVGLPQEELPEVLDGCGRYQAA